MKGAYKDKCFGESVILRKHWEFKKGVFSVELASKPGQPENVVNDWDINILQVILHKNPANDLSGHSCIN